MNQIDQIWNKRVKAYWDMAIRYLRLIGNSGFLFTIYLAIIVGSYYYSELLKWLPERFPASIFLAVTWTILLTNSPTRTFLKKGDIVFLSPIEEKMASYFKRSYIYSLLMQFSKMVFVAVVITPMYRFMINEDVKSLLFIVIVSFIAKAWNLLFQWEEQRLLYENHRMQHFVLRFLLNFVLAFLLFKESSIILILSVIGLQLFLYLFYYQHFKKRYSLKWESLVEVEEKMLMMFYRIANTFTDVPKLSTKVKRRRIISNVLKLFPFSQNSTYHVLFFSSFIRANDYYGIFIRLFLVGFAFIYIVPFTYGRIFVSLLFIYMSGLQLSTLKQHHTIKIWPDLYPISLEQRKYSLSNVLFVLLTTKSLLFSGFDLLVYRVSTHSAVMLVSNILLAYCYSYLFLHKEKKKQ